MANRVNVLVIKIVLMLMTPKGREFDSSALVRFFRRMHALATSKLPILLGLTASLRGDFCLRVGVCTQHGHGIDESKALVYPIENLRFLGTTLDPADRGSECPAPIGSMRWFHRGTHSCAAK